jgi:outer membrane protein TolC
MKRKPASILKIILAVVLTGGVASRTGAQVIAQTQSQHEFTVKQAVDYAMKNSVQVKNALLDVQIQTQTNREITSAAFPQLNASSSATYNPNLAVQTIPDFISPLVYKTLVDNNVKNGSGQPIVSPTDFEFFQAAFGTKYNANIGLDLSQILFDGQVFVGLQARTTSMDWARKNVEVTEEVIKANVYKVYYQLVAGKTQIDLIDANITRLSKLQHDTKALFENGFAEKLDVDKLSVQIANLETEKKRVLNDIAKGYLGLKLLMGMPIKDNLVLTDTLSDSQIKEGILEASNYNYSDRPEYEYAELGKKLNEFNIKRYKLSQLPTVSLSSSWSKMAMRDRFDFFSRGDWFTASSISLRISVPIFHGFAIRSRVDKAKLDLQRTENQIQDLKLNIDNQVETARLEFRTAIESMDFQKQNMKLAEDIFEQTKKKYEAGLGSNTEITTAQTDLKSAQSNYINALYDAIVARIDFLKAIGKL